MLANLLLWVYLLSLNQDTLKKRYNIGNAGKTASMSMLALFESKYTLKERYNIGNVGKTDFIGMLTLFESRLKGRYCISNVGKTASMGVLWPSGLMHWTQVLVLPECGFESQPGRSRRLCCVLHVKEPRTLIVKEKGLAPVFLDSCLEHLAGWICARYKSYHYHYHCH